jgi:enolase-phosphatase E1
LRAIILDIEGTTTPIAFVYERLFPYARTNLRRYLETHRGSREYLNIIERLKREHDADLRDGSSPPEWTDVDAAALADSVARYVGWLMDRDRKSPGLKELQGQIWEEGYSTGALVGEVFDDVPAALRRWQARGVEAGIFSSGSVLAQQQLFRHSSAGDLTPLLRWHFDTTIGAKQDPHSYARIAASTGVAASAILFISDVVPELDAARVSGMRTALSVRPGNAPPPAAHDHPVIQSLDEVKV